MGLFSQFIIYGQFIAERYTYVPNVAFCILLTSFITSPIIYTIIVTLYFYRSLTYVPAYKSNQNLFSYGISQFPRCPENYNNLGSFFIERGDHYSAIKPMLLAERLTVGNKFGIYVQLANIYSKCRQYQEGFKWTTKALDIAPLNEIAPLMEQRNELERRLYRVQKYNKELVEMQL